MNPLPDHTITDRVFSATNEIALKDPGLSSAFIAYINQLIKDDFDRLVMLLYRVDVNENKLRQMLSENPGTDAGKIIAALIIERQLQKIESRRKMRRDDDMISEDEKW